MFSAPEHPRQSTTPAPQNAPRPTSEYQKLSFILSGYYNYSGSVNNQGSNGNFWSASANNNTNARNLNFNTSNVNPSNNNNKANGNSVRCVAL